MIFARLHKQNYCLHLLLKPQQLCVQPFECSTLVQTGKLQAGKAAKFTPPVKRAGFS